MLDQQLTGALKAGKGAKKGLTGHYRLKITSRQQTRGKAEGLD